MTTAYRYIAKELIVVLVVVFVLLMVVSIGARFTGYMQEAADGKFSADILWTLMVLRLPEFVQLALPFSLVLAVVITFGRIHADQEYVVLTVGGASPTRMTVWLLSVIVPIAFIVGLFSLAITPLSREMFVQLLVDTAVSHEFDAVAPGEFRELSGGRRVVYVDQVNRDEQVLLGVFLYEQSNKQTSSVSLADSAQFVVDADSGERHLRLQHGRRYEGIFGPQPLRILEFEELSIRLNIEEDLSIPLEVEALPTVSLRRTSITHVQELDWRLSLPLMTLVSGLLAFGLSRTKPRSGRYGQIIPGLFSFLGYYLLLKLIQLSTSEAGSLSTSLMVGAHGSMLCLAVYCLHRQTRPK